MKKTRKVKKEEEIIRANAQEINFQWASVGLRCASGWPQNSTVRVFDDIGDAWEHGIELKKAGKLLPQECNVNIFEREQALPPVREQLGKTYRQSWEVDHEDIALR